MNGILSKIVKLHPPSQPQQVRRSLCLLGIAVGLHTIVDPALTYLAVIHLEVGFEMNSLMRPWLRAGLIPFILIHLPVYAFSIGAGVTFRWLLQQASGREQMVIYYLSVIGFSGLICWGLALVANNLWILWIGL
jgi:hypothetical protein